jgi:hypothetical protein
MQWRGAGGRVRYTWCVVDVGRVHVLRLQLLAAVAANNTESPLTAKGGARAHTRAPASTENNTEKHDKSVRRFVRWLW